MSADFTPPLKPYNDVSKFRFWCQKVLPLVYDDSLSYYEVLNKVVDYLNNVIENMDNVEDNVKSVYDAFVELQNYVNEYFDSQDWQSMVNNKIDQLVIEGYFEEIIEPLVTEDFNRIVVEFNEFKEEVNGDIQSQNDEIDEFKNDVSDEIDDFKEDVNSDLQTQNENIAVLVARMDTFASLPDGSTSGDAELLDIRVGADGTVYPSAGDAVRAQVGELNNALEHIVQVGKNKAKFGQYGYILQNGNMSDTGTTYYKTTEPVTVKNGETITVSAAADTLFIRLRIAKKSDNTYLIYQTALSNTADGRQYTTYTATQDCTAVVSYIDYGYPQIEFSNIPTSYEPYTETLNGDIVIEDLDEAIEDIAELQTTKADLRISPNIYEFDAQGYVSIQNTLLDADTHGYHTSKWFELENGQKAIFSGESNFIRVYIGRNTEPTTGTGSRIAYITEYTGTTEDERYYVAYTATEHCYIRASYLRVDLQKMIEITTENTPSAYEPSGKSLASDIRVNTAEQAEGLTNSAKANLDFSYWYGKKVLCIGDSLTAAGVWQQKLSSVLGMNVSTHAKGGIGFPAMLDGSPSSGGSDPTLAPLSTDDVGDKDLIIVYGGYNHRGSVDGQKGDLYPTNNTVYGCLQYLINGVYNLLVTADNLKCRLVVVTPHCAGKYSYIPYSWNEEYPVGSGRTGETLVEAIKACASDNWVACLDLYHTSGISPFTWNVFSASSTPETGGQVNDQLHLNPSIGYPYLGERISHWIDTV